MYLCMYTGVFDILAFLDIPYLIFAVLAREYSG